MSPLGELAQLVRVSRRVLDVVAESSGARHFGLPVDGEAEAVLRQQLLARLTLMGPRHIRGRHRDQMRRSAPTGTGVGNRRRDPGRTEKVHLDRLVKRRIETHRGGRVDHDVA